MFRGAREAFELPTALTHVFTANWGHGFIYNGRPTTRADKQGFSEIQLKWLNIIRASASVLNKMKTIVSRELENGHLHWGKIPTQAAAPLALQLQRLEVVFVFDYGKMLNVKEQQSVYTFKSSLWFQTCAVRSSLSSCHSVANPPTSLSVNLAFQYERPGLNLGFPQGRKPIHSPSLWLDPPTWAPLLNSHSPCIWCTYAQH